MVRYHGADATRKRLNIRAVWPVASDTTAPAISLENAINALAAGAVFDLPGVVERVPG